MRLSNLLLVIFGGVAALAGIVVGLLTWGHPASGVGLTLLVLGMACVLGGIIDTFQQRPLTIQSNTREFARYCVRHDLDPEGAADVLRRLMAGESFR